jgi:signal transduction histidine kinase
VNSTEQQYQERYATFISMAVHDLQSPIRKLGVLSDRLLQKYEAIVDDEAKQYTERMKQSLHQIQSLVAGLGEMAEAIPENMRLQEVDLEKIISRVKVELSSLIRDKEASIVTKDLPRLFGDPEQIKKLLKKLIENALVFCREGVQLVIDLCSEPVTAGEIEKFNLDPGKTYHKIIVQDNGIGFEQQDAEKIFDPLIRLHGKSGFPGNGLGLALVKKIAINHHGIIYAEGRDGQGARFTFILPENRN